MSKNKSGIKVPARPANKVPDVDQAELDDWLKNGRRDESEEPRTVAKPAARSSTKPTSRTVPAPAEPEPASDIPDGPMMRMTFRISEPLHKRFQLALLLTGEDKSEFLCGVIEEYIRQHVSVSDIQRNLEG